MQRSGTSKRRIINVFLFLIVVLLSWLVYQQTQSEQQEPATLYRDEIGNIMRTVSIHLPSQVTIMMQAEGEKWRMVEPLQATVNTKALQQLTTLLYEPVQVEYPAPGKRLSDFGLDDSAIRVRFNGIEYALGDLNPVNHYRYILSDQRILMVNEVVYELLSRGVSGFVEE